MLNKTKKTYQVNLEENLSKNIYEQDFLDNSYGFRPGRKPHDALKDLSRNIGTKKVGFIVDADIRGYFDHVDHEWLITMLKERISDSKILRLIKRFLKAGIMEEGELAQTDEGVPQGGSLSPLLGNIYLHYTLDLWFSKVVVKHCRGEAYLTRFADDTVACFQYQRDAQRFYEALKKRLGKFNLEIAQEKTQIIEFGRYAERDIKKRGGRKPETFDFLGFTHYCGRSRKGRFKLKWKTARKEFQAKVAEITNQSQSSICVKRLICGAGCLNWARPVLRGVGLQFARKGPAYLPHSATMKVV